MVSKEIRAVVVDGDKTLWKGRVAEGIGKSLLISELQKLHLRTFLRGFSGAKRVKSIIAENPGIKGETLGQMEFYNILTENHLGKKEDMVKIATNYINKNTIPEVSSLIFQFSQEGIPIFLSTAGGTTSLEAAIKIFKLTDGVSNTELFDKNNKLIGIELTITNGENKLYKTVELLNKYNIKLSDCLVIGDSALDIPILKASRDAVFSPLATEDVKQIHSSTDGKITSAKVYSIMRGVVRDTNGCYTPPFTPLVGKTVKK